MGDDIKIGIYVPWLRLSSCFCWMRCFFHAFFCMHQRIISSIENVHINTITRPMRNIHEALTFVKVIDAFIHLVFGKNFLSRVCSVIEATPTTNKLFYYSSTFI